MRTPVLWAAHSHRMSDVAVNAFALTNAGLMAGVTIDGTKVTKLDL